MRQILGPNQLIGRTVKPYGIDITEPVKRNNEPCLRYVTSLAAMRKNRGEDAALIQAAIVSSSQVDTLPVPSRIDLIVPRNATRYVFTLTPQRPQTVLRSMDVSRQYYKIQRA